MPAETLRYFHATEVDQDELLTVLLGHFASSLGNEEGVVFGRGDGGEYVLRVTFGRRGNMTDMTFAPSVSREEQQAIRESIERDLLADQQPTIAQRVGFSLRPVTGYFRYENRFQICPVPEGAPRIRGWGDDPFLLQVAHPRSPNWAVSLRRAEVAARRCFAVLNVLSNTRIHGGPAGAQSSWALHPADNISAWEQSVYRYPGLTGELDGFSDVAGHVPIGLLPSGDYYPGTRGMSPEPFLLPENIVELLAEVDALQRDEKEQFERATIYFDHAEAVYARSRSLAYIGLISAVECVMEKAERCENCNQPLPQFVGRCDVCGQPRYSITHRFEEFMKAHVPFVEDHPWAWAKDRLYKVRSALAHGSDIMHLDVSPFGLWGWRQIDETRLEWATLQIVATAIRNWLRSRK